MENIIIRRGETLEISIKADDNTAQTVQLKAVKNDVVYFDETESFVDGLATIRTNETNIPVGEYPFTLKILYADGFIEILPDAEHCQGDCKLPNIEICDSLEDEPMVS